jgi:general secretion pathway protein C
MKKRLPLFLSFILFVALSASIAYWGLQFYKPPARQIVAPPQVPQAEASLDAAAGLFGGRLVAAAASNYQLKGVIAGGKNAVGVAILSADGKPAQAVGVGEEIAAGVTVKEVHPLYVLLSEGGALKRVDLPENKNARAADGLIVAAQATDAAQQNANRGALAQPPAQPTPIPPPLIGSNPNLAPVEPPQGTPPPVPNNGGLLPPPNGAQGGDAPPPLNNQQNTK